MRRLSQGVVRGCAEEVLQHRIFWKLPNDYRTASGSLAKGVPIGGELDYLDDGTIGAALMARRAL